MTKEEIMNTPQYLNKFDIMRIFDVGINKAMEIIWRIKQVSDIANIKGKVTIKDYELWATVQPVEKDHERDYADFKRAK